MNKLKLLIIPALLVPLLVVNVALAKKPRPCQPGYYLENGVCVPHPVPTPDPEPEPEPVPHPTPTPVPAQTPQVDVPLKPETQGK